MINADVRVGDVVSIVACRCESCRKVNFSPNFHDFNPALVRHRIGDKIECQVVFGNDRGTFDLTTVDLEVLEKGPAWRTQP